MEISASEAFSAPRVMSRSHGFIESGTTGRPCGADDVAPACIARFTIVSSSDW